MNDLGARGIQVFTNVAGKPLSAPEFRPIFARMVQHDLPVWVHPMRGPQFSGLRSEQTSENEIWFSFGWPYETTACMTRLIYSGLFDELPKLKIITHHMGGMIPYFAGKIALGFRQIFFGAPERNPGAEERAEEAAGRLLQDALCRHRAQRRRRGDRCGHAFFGTSRCLFATDAPFDAEQGRGLIAQDHCGGRGARDHAGRAGHAFSPAMPARLLRLPVRGGSHANAETSRCRLRDGEMGAYVAFPDKTPAGAIIAIMEIWGVNDTMRHHAHEFAEAGFVCLVPDLFWRQEPGVELSDHNPEHVKKAFDLYYDFDYDLGVRDMEDTLALSADSCPSATARSARSATASAASSAT